MPQMDITFFFDISEVLLYVYFISYFSFVFFFYLPTFNIFRIFYEKFFFFKMVGTKVNFMFYNFNFNLHND